MKKFILPNRAFLRLSGPDSERFFNGQITQNVSLSKEGKTLWTAVTDAKGRIEGVGCVSGLSDGSFLLDCPAEIGDLLEARLDKYLIADDCEWSREDGEWSIMVGSDLEGEVRESNRYRVSMNEVLLKESPSGVDELPETLEEEWRVRNGVPAWGTEIIEGRMPVECGLHEIALSFDKGCYIGQEIISRMETSGKARTRLYQVMNIPSKVEDLESLTTLMKTETETAGLIVSKKPVNEEFPGAKITSF